MARVPASLLLGALILLAGCSAPATAPVTTASGAPAATEAVATVMPPIDLATLDPCTLLDAETIAAVIQSPTETGRVQQGEDRILCIYDVPAGVSTLDGSRGITLSVFTTPRTVADAGPAFGGNTTDYDHEEIEGLGDAAWWSVHKEVAGFEPNAETVAISVVAEPVHYIISLAGVPGSRDAWRGFAIELAREVLAKIGA